MVAEWILSLASAGSAALITAAATDAWQSTRDGLRALFTRTGSRRQEILDGWLDEAARAVESASSEERDLVRQDLFSAWQVRMVDLLAEFPEMADDFDTWVRAVRAALPPSAESPVWTQTNTVRGGGTVFAVQAGSQHLYGAMPERKDP